MSSETDIAWAAGLFEGEGCFGHYDRGSNHQGRYHYAYATLGMTDHEIVLRFAEVVDCGYVKPPRKRTAHWKPIQYWETWKHEDVESLALAFAPWLSDRRLVAATSALASDTRRLDNATK